MQDLIKVGRLLIVWAIMGVCPSLVAVEESRIAAVVGDKIISVIDLDHRVRFALLSAGIDPTVAAQEKLRPQVLDTMIGEVLQLAKGAEFDITASPADIEETIQQIEHRHNMAPGNMKKMLADNNIPYDVFAQSVAASIVWGDYIRAKYQQTLSASPHEINQAKQKNAVAKTLGHTLLGEIVVGFDQGGGEEKAYAKAMGLLDALKKGASFSAIAEQFSDSASAARGGDIGWVPDGQLPVPILNDAVAALGVGQVTLPLKTPTGYTILMIRDKRGPGQPMASDVVLSFVQVLKPMTPPFDQGTVDRAIGMMNRLKTGASSCSLLKTLATSDPSFVVRAVDRAVAGQMPPQLSELLRALPAGASTTPVLSDQGVVLFMVCDRQETNQDDPSDDAIKAMIVDQKLGLVAMREMKTLRRNAHVHIRLKDR